MTLPNLIIIGAPKCATTTLFQWLVAHPQVAGSSRKEAQYLVDAGSSIFRPDSNYAAHGLAGYEALFPTANDVVVEATPGYLYQRTALDVCSTELTTAKLVVVVRDPVERFRSAYSYFTNNNPVDGAPTSFAEFVERSFAGTCVTGNEFVDDALTQGAYVTHLRRWADACGRERIMILRAEDLRRDGRAVLQTMAEWLGIEPAGFDTVVLDDHNTTYQVRNTRLHKLVAKVRPLIPAGRLRRLAVRAYRSLNVGGKVVAQADPAEITRLREYYQPFNDDLEAEFGVATSGWGRIGAVA